MQILFSLKIGKTHPNGCIKNPNRSNIVFRNQKTDKGKDIKNEKNDVKGFFSPRHMKIIKIKSGWPGSNGRPPGPKPGDLPTDLHPVIVAPEGFEPPHCGPKPHVLPLDERAI